jgi:hypothetical protein
MGERETEEAAARVKMAKVGPSVSRVSRRTQKKLEAAMKLA